MVAVFQFNADDCGAVLFVFLDAARIDGKSMQQRVGSFVLILGTKPGVIEKHSQKKQAQKSREALTRTRLLHGLRKGDETPVS
jgi:hypothetical protein